MKFGKLYDLQVLQSWNNVNIPQFLKLWSKRIWILRQLGLGIPGLGVGGNLFPPGQITFETEVSQREKQRERNSFVPYKQLSTSAFPCLHHRASERPQQTSLLNLATLNVKFLSPLS